MFNIKPAQGYVFLCVFVTLYLLLGREEEWETVWCSVASKLYCPAGNTTCTWFSLGKLYSIKYRPYSGKWSQPHKSFYFQDKLRGIVQERYQNEFRLLLSVWRALFSSAAPSGSIYKTDERLIETVSNKMTSTHLYTRKNLWLHCDSLKWTVRPLYTVSALHREH